MNEQFTYGNVRPEVMERLRQLLANSSQDGDSHGLEFIVNEIIHETIEVARRNPQANTEAITVWTLNAISGPPGISNKEV